MPQTFRSEAAARAVADKMGENAYAYECSDCSITVHGNSPSPYAMNRLYASVTTYQVSAWHVGVDTGAPWHQDRTSCDVSDVVEECRRELRARNGFDYEY